MTKYIYIALVIFAATASANCGSYSSGYGNLANIALSSLGGGGGASSYGAPVASGYAAQGASAYGAQSASAYGAQGASSYGAQGAQAPKYSFQPTYSTELYAGKQQYKTYNSAPYYSQADLPLVPGAPVANLYVPSGSSSYGSGSSSYGGAAAPSFGSSAY